MWGNPASELIVQAGMMIEDGRTYTEWKRYVFPPPTVGEIFKELCILLRNIYNEGDITVDWHFVFQYVGGTTIGGASGMFHIIS